MILMLIPFQDRHFLELLVISEIHCLSYPLNGMSNPPGHAERIHRHASRVRRVACDRIGAERLHAYCERVKEAFDAYVNGGWGAHHNPRSGGGESSDEDSEIGTDAGDAGLDKDVIIGDGEDDEDIDEAEAEAEAERGRAEVRRKEGNLERSERPEKAIALVDDEPGIRSRSRDRNETGLKAFDPFSDDAMEDQLATIDGLVSVNLDKVQEDDETSDISSEGNEEEIR